MNNLFADSNPPPSGERFEALLRCRNLLIERIVSAEVDTPTTYLQEQDEWVVLLQGSAVLSLQGRTHHLKPGDYLFLPASVAHVVERVSNQTIWLAIHLHPGAGEATGGVMR